MEYPIPTNHYYTFSSCTNRINDSTLLWRYLTFEKFIWLLENSNLYHARLDQLEDPLEGSVTKLYAQNRANQYPPEAREQICEIQPFFNRRSLFRSYVNCWHSSECESAAMWKLYSRQNAGVAITSTRKRLVESVTLPPDTEFGLLGPVEYLDFEKHGMMGQDGMARPGFAKQASFEYEREVRAMICLYPDQGRITIPTSQEYLDELKRRMPLGVAGKVDLKQLILKIHTSPLSPLWFNQIVQSAATRAGLGDIVVKSNLIVDPIY